jgi:hypothetical protein
LQKIPIYFLFIYFLAISSIFGIPASFTKIIPTSTFAKGFAVVAETGGVENIYHNPASIVGSKGTSVGVSYSSFYDNLYSTSSFEFITPLSDRVSIGFALPVKMISGIPLVVDSNGTGEQIGSFSDIETAGILSFAYKLTPNAYLGLNTYYYYRKIYEAQASNLGFDIGIIADYKKFAFGACLSNISNSQLEWTSGQKESQNQQITIGGLYRFTESFIGLADIEFIDGDYIVNVGAELWLTNTFAFTGGVYDCDRGKKISLGLQLLLNQFKWNYAFAEHDDLGLIQKVSLEVNFLVGEDINENY